MNHKHFSYAFLGLLVGVLMSTSVQYIIAWTVPSAAAPNNNVSAPLTQGLGTTYQSRDTGLGLTGPVNITNAGAQDNKLTAPKICLNNSADNTNCITDWSDISGTSAPGAYGGSYVWNNSWSNCHIGNRFTGGCSCPAGFSAHYMMTVENSRSYNMYECWGS